MPTNFIWDFDGMLFDSYAHITTAFQAMRRRLGLSVPAYDACYALFKRSFGAAYDVYDADAGQQMLFRAMESDLTLAPPVLPYEGIPSLVRAVTARGGLNFLNTRRDSLALTYLDRAGLLLCFTDAVTSESLLPPKPAPDTLRYLAEKYKLDPRETVMLGDRRVDVDAGRAAGVRTCLFDETGDLAGTPCDWYVREITQIWSLLPDAS